MNERDLLDVFGMLSDETVARTVLTAETKSKPVTEPDEGISEIERLIAKKPEPAVKKQPAPERKQKKPQEKKIRMRIPTSAVVAACVLLNIGILFGVYKMKVNNPAVEPASSVSETAEQKTPFIEVQENSVSPIACTVVIYNPTNETIYYGVTFHLYDMDGTELNKNVSFAYDYEIEPGKTGKLNCQYGSYLYEDNDEPVYAEEHKPLSPGKYDISVSLMSQITNPTEYHTTFVVPDTFQNKRPLMVGSGEGFPLQTTLQELEQVGIIPGYINIEVEPAKENMYEEPGRVHRMEPDSGLFRYREEVYPGNMHTGYNPEDIVWMGLNEMVTLYVSSGSSDPDIIRLPDFSRTAYRGCWKSQYALEYLEMAAECSMCIAVQPLPPDDEHPDGTVYRSEPATTENEIAELHKGDTVRLYVSSAAVGDSEPQEDGETVTVPYMFYWDYQTAEATLLKLGLQVEKKVMHSNNVAKGCVIETSLSGSTREVKKGAKVWVAVSDGKPGEIRCTVPDFTGMAMETAVQTAKTCGFRVSFRLVDHAETKGTVIQQDHAPGLVINADATVELLVSNGNG